ncbi:galaxin [Etheostoma spectabile]|uniref:galaxin n=1 Tax=Etheostoma spectabile TaxID=54343 RepID=UPI0013AEF331|nr:galaxin-like [Etheostoma spectabile]
MAYDQLNEICCNSKIIAKPGPNAQCCDSDAFDVDKQMCCGPVENKTILMKKSRDHLCCGRDQFDPNTEWCCLNEGLKTKPNTSMCCVNESE